MEEGIDLKSFFKYLWTKKKTFIFIVLFVLLVANIVLYAFTEFKYTSVGKVKISTPATSEILLEYKDLLRSDSVIEAALNNLNIAADMSEIRNNLYISAIVDTNIYSITFNYKDKNYSGRLCDSLIKEFSSEVEMYDGSIVSLYEPAVTNDKPIDFSLFRYESKYFFVGCLVALGYVFVIFYLDDRIKSEREVSNYNILGKLDNQDNINLVKTKIKLGDSGPFIFISTPRDIKCRKNVLSLVKDFSKNSKVLFIDTNIRTNDSKIVGFSDLLHNYKDDLSNYIKNNKEFDIMESGTYNKDTELLLTNKNVEKLIGNLKKKYDYVIFYNSNIIDYSDSLILSKLCNGNYMIVGIDKTNKTDFDESIKAYNQINTKVNGIIIIDKE